MCPWTSHIREEYRQPPTKQKGGKMSGGHKCYKEKYSKVKRVMGAGVCIQTNLGKITLNKIKCLHYRTFQKL